MVAEDIELRVIRIVACTYRIDIVALEAEAMTGVGSLYSIAVPVLEFQNDRVEIRLLLGPENRSTYRKPYPDGPAACIASTDG